MDSFFVPSENMSHNSLAITGEEHHHLTKVLRKKVGDTIIAVNGRGRGYRCSIEKIDIKRTICLVDENLINYNESSVDVSIAFPVISDRSRIEWMVEKGTELGVREFIFFRSQRTERKRVRFDRLNKIAISGMKQCLRSVLPSMIEFSTFEELLRYTESDFDTVYVGNKDLSGERLISKVYQFTSGKKLLLVVGPEGGLTKEEIDSFEDKGAVFVSLGQRRLRSETAALRMAAFVITD